MPRRRGMARYAGGLVAAAVVWGALSCGPVDEVPLPDAEKQASIEQLAQMLQAGGGEAPAVAPLADRLDSLSRFPPAESATRALAIALIDTMSRTSFPPETSERLARQLYRATNGGYLRRHRLEQLTGEIEKELLAARVPAKEAAAVREAGVRVAREPRHPRRDWW